MPPTESTPLLDAVAGVTRAEAEAMVGEIARSWKWIMALGVVNIIAGFACLMAPVTATFLAEAVISWALVFVGVANGLAACYAEQALRLYYISLGLVQIAIGLVMLNHPFETLATLTLIIAIVVLLDGLYRVWVCLAGSMAEHGWGLMMVSGLASVALGVIVLSGMPETSLFVIGILLGVNLITVGNLRIHVAWQGRCIANQSSGESAPAALNV